LNLQRKLFEYLQPRFSKGLFLKLRHAYPHPLRMWRALHDVDAEQVPPSLHEQIVVVGLGPAAMSCLRELKREGFRHVTVVAKDELYGGKCVNFGCMPIEYTLHLKSQLDQRKGKIQNYVTDLRKDVEEQFVGIGYLLRKGEAVEISGKSLRLADGSEIAFERLISAIGNQTLLPARVPADLQTLIDLNDFWQLAPGKKVTIYAGTNVTSLALGDVAIALGLEPTILLTTGHPFEKLPSFRYFLRELGRRGVKILENCRILSAREKQVQVESAGKTISLENDHFLVMDRPEPRFLSVDGFVPEVYDLDLRRACLPQRPDIIFLGDGSGLFTAAEADQQARILMAAWKIGTPADLRVIDTMPFYIHGHQSLAMVGAQWTLTSKAWAELDFRSLGWSKAHGLEGKLWYLLDTATGKIIGLHICHTLSPELISLGAILLDFPVWDMKWQNTTVHPSASEIFKFLADQALVSMQARPDIVSNYPNPDYQEFEFRLPLLDTIKRNALPDWINLDQYLQVIMASQPYVCLAAYFALAKLLEITRYSSTPWRGFEGCLMKDGQGSYYVPGEAKLKFSLSNDTKFLNLSYAGYLVRLVEIN